MHSSLRLESNRDLIGIYLTQLGRLELQRLWFGRRHGAAWRLGAAALAAALVEVAVGTESLAVHRLVGAHTLAQRPIVPATTLAVVRAAGAAVTRTVAASHATALPLVFLRAGAAARTTTASGRALGLRVANALLPATVVQAVPRAFGLRGTHTLLRPSLPGAARCTGDRFGGGLLHRAVHGEV